MLSSNAAWVRGGIRLISSASRNCVNTGPLCKENSLVFGENTVVPKISAGIMSGVPCTLRNTSERNRASVFTASVFATPGTPSTNAWPPQSSRKQCLLDQLLLPCNHSPNLFTPLLKQLQRRLY